MTDKKIGTLYIVATPIGNLPDITLRAIDVLKEVDKIAVEDTRHAAKLLKHYSIQKPMFSLHDHNERERAAHIVNALRQGENIALISDAGTPLISDPGYHLVKAVQAAHIKVVPIPGASAAMAALCAAGLPTDRFTFEGFLPTRDEARKNRLLALATETSTLIFYEAPHRLLASLQTMREVFGPNRIGVVARELTKLHETIYHHDLSQLCDHFSNHESEIRGEIVILIAGAIISDTAPVTVQPEAVLDILLTVLPLKQAATIASSITGIGKNILYKKALAKKDQPSSP